MQRTKNTLKTFWRAFSGCGKCGCAAPPASHLIQHMSGWHWQGAAVLGTGWGSSWSRFLPHVMNIIKNLRLNFLATNSWAYILFQNLLLPQRLSDNDVWIHGVKHSVFYKHNIHNIFRGMYFQWIQKLYTHGPHEAAFWTLTLKRAILTLFDCRKPVAAYYRQLPPIMFQLYYSTIYCSTHPCPCLVCCICSSSQCGQSNPDF